MNLFKKSGFVALVLDEESIELLRKRIPPRYKKIFYHHVTIEYRPNIFKFWWKYKSILENRKEIKTKEIIFDESAEALTVDCKLSENKIPHISLSTVEEKRANYSNEMLNKLPNSKRNKKEIKIILSGKIKFIKR